MRDLSPATYQDWLAQGALGPPPETNLMEQYLDRNRGLQLAGNIAPLPIAPGPQAGQPTSLEAWSGVIRGLPRIYPETEGRLDNLIQQILSVKGPRGRQYGGPVSPGQSYTVGEGGPEVFVPQVPGTIIPNQSSGLGRSRFVNELADPVVRDRLIAYTKAEVGSQGPQAQQAFMESIFNRATARGQTLRQTLSGSYFPDVTHRRAARGTSEADRVSYTPLINQVVGGSNVSNFATGNASGRVGFAGGPQVAAFGGERFGVEGPDRGWWSRVGAEGPTTATFAERFASPEAPSRLRLGLEHLESRQPTARASFDITPMLTVEGSATPSRAPFSGSGQGLLGGPFEDYAAKLLFRKEF